jgi:hypothetical protein
MMCVAFLKRSLQAMTGQMEASENRRFGNERGVGHP